MALANDQFQSKHVSLDAWHGVPWPWVHGGPGIQAHDSPRGHAQADTNAPPPERGGIALPECRRERRALTGTSCPTASPGQCHPQRRSGQDLRGMEPPGHLCRGPKRPTGSQDQSRRPSHLHSDLRVFGWKHRGSGQPCSRPQLARAQSSHQSSAAGRAQLPTQEPRSGCTARSR